MCWWGLMQATSSTESGQHVPLSRDLLVPAKRAPTGIDGPRRIWELSKDGLETRIERWDAGTSVTLHFQRPIKEVFMLRGSVTLAVAPAEGKHRLEEGDWA